MLKVSSQFPLYRPKGEADVQNHTIWISTQCSMMWW